MKEREEKHMKKDLLTQKKKLGEKETAFLNRVILKKGVFLNAYLIYFEGNFLHLKLQKKIWRIFYSFLLLLVHSNR